MTMIRFGRVLLGGALGLLLVSAVEAQDLIVYDDALQNTFENYSYGPPGLINLSSTAPVHGGIRSISFIGQDYNAFSAFHPADLTTAQYPTLHFWVHGGAAGGQQLQIFLQLDDDVVASAPLDTYIAGGSIVAGAWREVTVNFAAPPLSYSGSFDRIDLQSDFDGAQPVFYLDDLSLVPGGTPPPANLMQIERAVTVGSMVSDRFTWRDAADKPRVAVLAHNTGQLGPVSPGGYPNHGGALREFRYQLPGGATRIAGVTNYGNGGYGGFGYVVSHRGDGSAGGIADDSPLGYAFTGGIQRVFEGRHHAIFRFTQLYPRYSSTTASPPNHLYNVPVTIDWLFSTGRDNPVWAVTWDLSGVPVNALNDDSRGPYGELNIDGQGFIDIDGVAWGDRYRFTSTTAPVTLDSEWTWNLPNTVPHVKLWIASSNATMGIVETQTMTQQDAGGGRNPFYHDVTQYWNKTSADGNAGNGYTMPWQDSWPYQANSFSIGPAGGSNNNARLTWGTQYGFLGQQSYIVNDGVVATASGWPKKSYSAHIVIGTHGASPVEAQVAQVEAVQSLTLTAAIGTVVASGPAGVARTDTVAYAPAGYNQVYGALAFRASSNALDANVAVGAGTLRKPLVIVGNYTAATYPTVRLGGVPLTMDVDYFPSRSAAANELWITLNRDLTGAVNHLEVLSPAPAPPLTFYTVPPCRVIDTRTPAGAPALAAGGIRTIATAGTCGLPSTAKGLAVNMTITSPAAPGFLTLYPADVPSPPLASNINFRPGNTRANNAVLPLAADGGGIKVYNGSAGTVHFILDVSGWFE
jgi:hypothetical protein